MLLVGEKNDEYLIPTSRFTGARNRFLAKTLFARRIIAGKRNVPERFCIAIFMLKSMGACKKVSKKYQVFISQPTNENSDSWIKIRINRENSVAKITTKLQKK